MRTPSSPTTHLLAVAARVAALGVLALLWFTFAPAQLGGRATYVVTDGTSMQPKFHGGDLAIVRPESNYRVGQIVAYNNRQLGKIVLHRIVALDGDRYVFKGDNNGFQDFEHPTKSQLIGALWIQVPGFTTRFGFLHSPWFIGSLVALAVLLFGGSAFRNDRRRRRNRRATSRSLPRSLQRSHSASSA
jgi:signal peptidase I